MHSVIVPDNVNITLSFVKWVVLRSAQQGVTLHNLAVISVRYCICVMVGIGVRMSTTSTSFPHCLQLLMNTAMHYGIEAEDRYWRHRVEPLSEPTVAKHHTVEAVVADFRVLCTVVRLKLFKHYQVPHTWSRVVVDLRILYLLPAWTCLNNAMHHVLKTEELTVYSITICTIIVKLKILRYNLPHLRNRGKNILESSKLLLDWSDFIVTIYRILEFEVVYTLQLTKFLKQRWKLWLNGEELVVYSKTICTAVRLKFFYVTIYQIRKTEVRIP